MKFFSILFVGIFFSINGFSALQAEISVDGLKTKKVVAGKPSVLGIQFSDPENPEPLHHFHPMHGKELHTIIVNEDLSHFAHFHPAVTFMDPLGNHHHAGYFEAKLNQSSSDPDNQDLIRATPFGGEYFIFAESMPMGYSMTTLPLQMSVEGLPKEKTPLVLDPVLSDGKIIKQQDGYQFTLNVETYPHCGTFSVLLKVFIEKLNMEKSLFEPVLDLQPWLQTFGHAVLISEAGTNAKEKKFIHLHAVWPLPGDPSNERGPFLEITTDNHGLMVAGVYKTWVQFNHLNQIHTVPFVIELKEPTQFPFDKFKSELCL